jgi:hypothetical protein
MPGTSSAPNVSTSSWTKRREKLFKEQDSVPQGRLKINEAAQEVKSRVIDVEPIGKVPRLPVKVARAALLRFQTTG